MAATRVCGSLPSPKSPNASTRTGPPCGLRENSAGGLWKNVGRRHRQRERGEQEPLGCRHGYTVVLDLMQ
jgi:hypothetical protein